MNVGSPPAPMSHGPAVRRIRAVRRVLAWLVVVLGVGCRSPHARDGEGARWWKGNLHTHSLWSDGDDYPEMVALWYRERGYHFLTVSDHNVMQSGERWHTLESTRGGGPVLDAYRAAWGPDWVRLRMKGTNQQVRLRPLDEYRGRVEQPGRFLLVAGEEVTDRHLTAPLHLNVHNLARPLQPAGGSNVVDVLQRNINAVLAQRRETGRPMFLHVNHPNFGWAITAEELMQVRGMPFFEVHNGHPSVHNEGDAGHPGTERMWDIALAWRLAFLGLEPLLGLAVDDGHHYHAWSPDRSNPGRGWVWVRSRELTPGAIVRAMEQGDFYASSGVVLRDVQRGDGRLLVEVDARPGEALVIEFIGTLHGFDARREPLLSGNGLPLRVTQRYSGDVGRILKTVHGTRAEYRLRGDEWYVRARVTSTRPVENPGQRGELQRAWTQPLVGARPPQGAAGRR